MDAACQCFNSFCLQKLLLTPLTRVDLSEETIHCLILPVGLWVMTGTAMALLTGMSGTTVAELMKG